MPDDLRARLEEAAATGNRSLHAEIVARLQASFDAPRIAETSEFLTGMLLLLLSKTVAAQVDPETFPAQESERVEAWMQLAVAMASGERAQIKGALTRLLGEIDESSVDVLYRIVLAQDLAERTAKALGSMR